MNFESLIHLGWSSFFQQQITLEEWGSTQPARVVEQHKNLLEVAGEQGHQSLPIVPTMPAFTVGDWVLLERGGRFVRLLDRSSCFSRKAAGTRLGEQLIAANVDTAFILASLNDDFNLNRIERYLCMAHEANVQPVVVLSKADLCDEPGRYRELVQRLDSSLCVETVNGLDRESTSVLSGWCKLGQTVVLLGSSGAGKSTLANTLLGEQAQATAAIREPDAKGRHTTTRRSLLEMPGGGLILDTPGMRELQLSACEEGISATFADIEELARGCRFSDCQHSTEPGCAVLSALDSGALDERRLRSYSKLLREQALNAASLAERHANARDTNRLHKRIQAESKWMKRGDD